MELLLTAKAPTGGIITLSYLFEVYKKEDNEFLYTLGFHEGNIRNIKPYSVTKSATIVRTDITLAPLVLETHGHFMYEGRTIFENCEPTLYFVSQHLNWMSEAQYSELNPNGRKLKNTIARAIGLNVYQNIDENLSSFPLNITAPLPRPKFPVAFKYAQFMYSPRDDEEVGTVEPQYLPGWLPQNVSLITPSMPGLPYGLKYLPFYYQLADNGQYSPVYVIVPESYSYTMNLQPPTIPIVIRSNLPNAMSNVRPLVEVKMGVARIDPELIAKLENEELKRRLQDQMAKVEEKKNNITKEVERKKAEEVKKLEEDKKKQDEVDKSNAEREKKLKEEEFMRKRRAIRWERRCVAWSLVNIVNRYFKNEEAWDLKGVWKGGDKSLYTCIEWKDVRVGEFGEEVDENGEPVNKPKPPPPANNSTNSTNSTNSSQPQQPSKPKKHKPLVRLNKKKCDYYLSVILNRNWKDTEFTDLVKKECKGRKPQQTSIKNLAMVGLHEITSGDEKVKKLGPEKIIKAHKMAKLAEEAEFKMGEKMDQSLLSPIRIE
jgi:hypothetical protein